LDNLEFDMLNREEASSLENHFEEREVIKGMDRDKAPDPDDFFMAFFQDCWEVVKRDFFFNKSMYYIKSAKGRNP
jgi:hypothetical protein